MIYTSFKKIDEVGRVVLPKDIRDKLGIRVNDMIKIDVDNNKAVITKAEKSCVFCGKSDRLRGYMGKTVCSRCVSALVSTAV